MSTPLHFRLHELDLSRNIIGDVGVPRYNVPCGTVYRWNILALCGLNIISILDFRAKVVPTIPPPAQPTSAGPNRPPILWMRRSPICRRSVSVDAPGPETPAECLCGCAGARDAGGKVCETKKNKKKKKNIYILWGLNTPVMLNPRGWVGGSRRNNMRYFTQ